MGPVALDLNTNYNLISQRQIWNLDNPCPVFGVAAKNKVSFLSCWRGASNFESHVEGPRLDYVELAIDNN